MKVHNLSKQNIRIVQDFTNNDSFEPFPCTACGQCCRNVHLSPLTEYLSRGDGVCRYLDEQTNLCSIYEERPLICNVENFFKLFLKDKISWANYVRQNLDFCQALQIK